MTPGGGQAIVTTTFADARKAYDANGRLIETPSYRKFETRVYVEHGVLDWLTVVAEGGYMNFSGAAGPLRPSQPAHRGSKGRSAAVAAIAAGRAL